MKGLAIVQTILVVTLIAYLFNLSLLVTAILVFVAAIITAFLFPSQVVPVTTQAEFDEAEFNAVFDVCSNINLPTTALLTPNVVKASPKSYTSDVANKIVSFYSLHKMNVTYVGVETGVKLDMYIFKAIGKSTKTDELVPMSTANIVAPKSELAREFGFATEDITFSPTIVGQPGCFGVIVPSKYSDSATIRLKNVFEDFQSLIANSQKQFPDICLLNAVPVVLGSGTNNLVYHDMVKNPHVLIAGATGSGKSVCLSTILASLMMLHTEQSLHLYLADLKGGIELNVFEKAKHVKRFCDTTEETVDMLIGLETEMARRISLIKNAGKKSIVDYNESLKSSANFLPFIVVVIDEFITLVGNEDSMNSLVQLTAKARSAGIFIILSLQRPDANTVPGLIKANMNCRISFKVTSIQESRIILDDNAAGEDCRGAGDGYVRADGKLTRFQGCFVGHTELDKIIKFYS